MAAVEYKFQVSAGDVTYQEGMLSGCINGGTLWLDNIVQAIRWHGYETDFLSWIREEGSEYLIAMSEYMDHNDLKKFAREHPGKLICLLGHFTDKHPSYPHMTDLIKICGLMLTPWEGQLLEGINAKTWPHAYNDLIDDKKSVDRRGSIVFAGNPYNLRNERWLKFLPVTRIYATLPKDMPAVYRGADVCVNIHGDFQKNIRVTDEDRLSDKPGMMINERFWNVLGSGGLLVTDWVPQMARWFEPDELIVAKTEQQFKDLTEYYVKHREEGLKILEKARNKVRSMHTYRHRVADMLGYLGLEAREVTPLE